MPDLTGQVAVITGGGGGIGRATAHEFVRNGVTKLVIVDINAEMGQETVAELKDAGADAMFVQADVREEEDVLNYVEKTKERFGRIDIFFNNAGYEGMVAPITDYPLDEYRKVLSINVDGVFMGMKFVIPVMMENGGGAIINTASVAGLDGTPMVSAYGASKWAVVSLTRSVAAEVAEHGIRVNAVCPSPIENRMMRSLEAQTSPDAPEAVKSAYIEAIPAKRYGTNEEVAQAVAFLASEEASWVIGVALPVDGGLTAKLL